MIKNIENLINQITDEIKEFTDIAVVGLSGGADSTLVAILCMKALGKENVVGLHLPYDATDMNSFNKRSKIFAEKLDIKNYELPIGWIVSSLDEQVCKARYEKGLSITNKGNSRARARMCLLYSFAHELETDTEKRVRVMNTCNLSESMLGYETKFGDGAGDIAIVGDLYKSEVYQLLDYFKDKGIITEDMIDRVPSAGLFDGQTDQGELGYSYDEMESSMRFIRCANRAILTGKIITEDSFEIEDDVCTDLIKNIKSPMNEKVLDFVWNKYLQCEHKRIIAPPVIELREFCD